ERQPQSGLAPSAVVETSPPVRNVDDPASLRRRVGFRPVLVPLIRTRWHDHTWRDFKRRVQMFELRDDVPFQVLARFRADVEGRQEEPPVLEAVVEVGNVLRLEFEEELPDAPSLRPRLKGDASGRFPNARAWHEAQSWLKTIADLFPVERQIPSIVRVRQAE